ncbi:hypothetical protein [Oceanisphaera pacifica]|uniref:PAS domain-containing protein n=1 Tax=Oceanisphaera pacifica TaxID=2818389 RepID=A0ABS3NJ15_9GAMM|nr:hypothetical protein [Oceanisphaera pacifica]MBO1520581.1 hypothetical protein [Oceanisphaera pacifica]
MLFQAKKHLAKIETLEAELAIYHNTEKDLQEEMIYFALDNHGQIIESNSKLHESLGYSSATS